ncbi:MAG: SCO family protein [Verrucomicrobiota bacterium]
MSPYSRNLQRLVWGFLALVILAIGSAFVWSRLKQNSSATEPLPIYGQVQDFVLTNQLGESFSNARLRSQIWIADIIFTRCAGPCPVMTHQMSLLQAALAKEPSVKLVSLTADPEFDTPGVLKTYADGFQAESSRWFFLTGHKKEIYRLAQNDLKLAVAEENPATPVEERFIHSTRFVLVDGKGRVRGFFDSETAGANEQMLQAVHRLLSEKP